jgi:zinc transport system ATP-binding protein
MSNAIDIKNLTIFLGGKEILSDINLVLEEGKFLGIVGPNGGGKTTLLKVILSLVRPVSGSVNVFGKAPAKAVKEKVFGYLPQHMNVDSGFPATAMDIVLMGLYRRFRKIPGDGRKKAEEMLATMGMSSYADHSFGRLSGGEQQRVSIARALVSEPRLLILDEPSTGIDVVGQEDFYHLLKGLQKRFGLSIVMVSHDIGVITAYIDEIACLNKNLHYQGSPLGALNEDVLKELYGKSMEVIMHSHLCEKCERLQPGER